jgi:hypothetical protein
MMMDTIGRRITGGPPGLVRVETQADGLEESSVRYLEQRRDGEEQPGIIRLDRQLDGTLFESDDVSLSVRAYKDNRIEVVIAVRRNALDGNRAA